METETVGMIREIPPYILFQEKADELVDEGRLEKVTEEALVAYGVPILKSTSSDMRFWYKVHSFAKKVDAGHVLYEQYINSGWKTSSTITLYRQKKS